MREDYKAAKKLAEEAVKEANKQGVSPYLPILDELDIEKGTGSEIRLGLLELPVARIIGNKESGRNSAFANNFMPLLEEGTEFASKWSNLYDSFLQEGIRDAIKVYEFMNDYYVQEGNKRVSVARFGGMDYILADVRRIMPKPNNTPEYKAYMEYLDFYDCTGNFNIVFSEPGEYPKLADLLGQTLDKKWSDSLCSELKSSFFSFCRICKKETGVEDLRKLSEAFLIYISLFPMKTISRDGEEQVAKNIRIASNEITGGGLENIEILESVPEGESRSPFGLLNRLGGKKRYTAASPLRVAFVYDGEIESSRWLDSHESGRIYVDEMTGDNVVTSAYSNGGGRLIDLAARDKNDIIFVVSSTLYDDALKAALQYPSTKIICCSVGQKHSSLKYYHGKMYEAAFLMGVLAADRLLIENKGGPRAIGYLAASEDMVNYRDLNAFAIGVSLIDPECKVLLTYANGEDFHFDWRERGVRYFADLDYSERAPLRKRMGLFRIDDNKNTYIGTPYFAWGRYYVQIVQSALSGAMELNDKLTSSTSYYFGLSTGVVDIRLVDVDYRTDKLLGFFKTAIVNGDFSPFTGEILSNKGEVIQEDLGHSHGISITRSKISSIDLLKMDWLNENIEEL